MTRKKILTAACLLAGLIFVLVLTQGGFHSKVPGGNTIAAKESNKELRTFKAETSRGAGDVTVAGDVVSRDTAQVASRVLGYVIELNVDAGDHVTKGQVLLRIDPKEMVEREAQARAALESAHADLVKAVSDFERYKALYEKESVSKKEYDDYAARYEVARAAEQRAQAALDEVKTQLSYAQLTAPFDGIVASRDVNLGDLATPGRSLLSIYMPGTLELVAAVGEQYANYLRVGDPVTVAVPSLRLEQTAKIREVVPQRDVKTRTLTVKVPLSEHEGVRPGLYGTLSFRTAESDVIVIPADAVTVVGQLESVKVLEDGNVKLRQVKTGRKVADGKVEIISGLNAGEVVVLK
jgi:membrane fusion protein, multidrug efflux system